jgi:arylsulfatase
MHRTGSETQMVGGLYVSASDLFYPKVFNIEMDPHEDVNVGGVAGWPGELGLKVVKQYGESIKKYPNPPAPNVTNFRGK